MDKLQLVDIRKYVENNSGQLSVIEQSEFPTNRVFWITDLYGSSVRGGHAHKKCEQLIVVLEGRCTVIAMNQSGESETFLLKENSQGLYVPPLHWLDIGDFRRPTILLVLASMPYDPEDYIHKREDFIVNS